MLSDEEEILIKKLRYCEQEYEQNGYLSVGKFKAIKEASNLIEKQYKEIEELKKYEKGYKLLSYSLDNYISKDKIKAKIEELKKENEQNRKDLERAINFSICNNIREKIFINMCIKDTLKSLLEKEE